jgi:hypothetical protein
MRWLTRHSTQTQPARPLQGREAELLASIPHADQAAVLDVAEGLREGQGYPPLAALEAAVMRYRRAHGL